MTNKKTASKRTSGKASGASVHDADEFDREFVVDSFKPPSPKARARWQEAKHKRGRPAVGKGSKVVSVSIERGLLERSDELARRMRISRARLIARGLRAVLASQGIEAP